MKTWELIALLGVGTSAALAALGPGYDRWHKDEESRRKAESATPERTYAPPPVRRDPVELVMQEATLHGAIAEAFPLMSDVASSPGTIALARWGARSMTWSALNSITETQHALVMKDSESERGKRVCGRGSVVQIAVIQLPEGRVAEGIFVFPGMKIVSFVAVGSTGTLVNDDEARFCGIVTGRHAYSSADGGFKHAVQAVGMFDPATLEGL